MISIFIQHSEGPTFGNAATAGSALETAV